MIGFRAQRGIGLERAEGGRFGEGHPSRVDLAKRTDFSTHLAAWRSDGIGTRHERGLSG